MRLQRLRRQRRRRSQFLEANGKLHTEVKVPAEKRPRGAQMHGPQQRTPYSSETGFFNNFKQFYSLWFCLGTHYILAISPNCEDRTDGRHGPATVVVSSGRQEQPEHSDALTPDLPHPPSQLLCQRHASRAHIATAQFQVLRHAKRLCRRCSQNQRYAHKDISPFEISGIILSNEPFLAIMSSYI